MRINKIIHLRAHSAWPIVHDMWLLTIISLTLSNNLKKRKMALHKIKDLKERMTTSKQ